MKGGLCQVNLLKIAVFLVSFFVQASRVYGELTSEEISNLLGSLVHYWPIQNQATTNLLGGPDICSNGVFGVDRLSNSGSTLEINSLPEGCTTTLNPILNSNGAGFSLLFWFKFAYTSSHQGLFYISNYDGSIKIQMNVASSVYFNVFNYKNGTSNIQQSASDSFDSDDWYHFALVYDNVQSVNMYMNGNLEISFQTINQLVVSQINFGIDLNSSFDEIKMFNRALGLTEILYDYGLNSSLPYTTTTTTTTTTTSTTTTTTSTTTSTTTTSTTSSTTTTSTTTTTTTTVTYSSSSFRELVGYTFSSLSSLSLLQQLQTTDSTQCKAMCVNLSNCILVLIDQTNCYMYDSPSDQLPLVIPFTGFSVLQRPRLRLYLPLYYWTTTFDPSLINYWPINNDLKDLIGNADLISRQPIWETGVYSQSVSSLRVIDDDRSYLTWQNGTYFTGDLTFTGWFNAYSCYNQMVYFSCASSSSDMVLLGLSDSTSNCIPFVRIGYENWTLAYTLSTNVWNHIALTLQNGIALLYINGAYVDTKSLTAPINSTRTQCYFGRLPLSAQDANASFDEMKIYNRALSSVEIKLDFSRQNSLVVQLEVSNISFNLNYTKLCYMLKNYWPIENETAYDVMSGSDLFSQTPTFSADQLGRSNSALRISNITNYWTAPNGSYFSNQFSITAWVKVHSITYWARLFEFRNADATTVVKLALSNETAGYPCFSLGSDSSTCFSKKIALNKWTHLAVTVSGTRLRYFLDGMYLGTVDVSQPFINTNTSFNYIGKSFYAGDGYADAEVDQIKIYSANLTLDQIHLDMQFNSYSLCSNVIDRSPLSIKITNSSWNVNPQKIPRSSTVIFVSNYSYSMSNDTRPIFLTYEWSLYQVDSATFETQSEVELENPTVSTSAFTLPGNTLSYGLYLITLTANGSIPSINLQVSATDQTYIKIMPTGIMVMALPNANSESTIGFAQSLSLSPRLYSVDSDNLVNVSSLTFYFYCRSVPNNSTKVNYLLSDSSALDLKTSVSTNTCFNSTAGYSIDSTGSVLTIKPNGLSSSINKSNLFVVSTVSNGIKYYQLLIVNVNTSMPMQPVVTLSCLVKSFCSDYQEYKVVSASNPLTLEAYYSIDTQYVSSLSFFWTAYKYLGDTPINFDVSAAKTTELTIPSRFFLDPVQKWRVIFTLNITSSSYPALSGLYSASILLLFNFVPFSLPILPPWLPCFVDRTTGYSMQTYFTIFCVSWADSDGLVKKYQFIASDVSNQTVINLGSSTLGIFRTQLPAGLVSSNFKWYLSVQVLDNLNGVATYYLTTPVTVNMNASAVNTALNSIVNMAPSSSIVQSLNSSDLSTVASTVLSFSATLNQRVVEPSLSSNETFIASVIDANEKLVNSLTKFQLTDWSTINAVSSALASVGAYPELLSTEAATEIISMCSQMAEGLAANASKYSIDYLNQAISNVFDASFNSLESIIGRSNSTETVKQVLGESSRILNSLTSLIGPQLGLNDSLTLSNSNFEMTIWRTTASSLETQIEINGAQIQFSDVCAIVGQASGNCSDEKIITQVYSRVSALDLNEELYTEGSSSIGISFFNSDMVKYDVTDYSAGFYFWIPKNNSQSSTSFNLVNMSNVTMTSANQLFTLSTNLTSVNQSITFEIEPHDQSLGYLLALRYAEIPVLNSTHQIFDLLQVFCPSSLQVENEVSFYKLFSNSSANMNKVNKVGLGFRQLVDQEFSQYCSSYSENQPITLSTALLLPSSIQNLTSVVSSPVSILVFASGCYFVDESIIEYSSWGVEILSDSNLTHSHCVSSHLTEFAGGLVVVPSTIDFNNVWANAGSFTRNMTIYLTVIIICSLYILLFVVCRYADWTDSKKRRIYFLQDNNMFDSYCYEIIVFTGNRRDAGTESNVYFIVAGSEGETSVRAMKPKSCKDQVLKRGSVNSFIMCVDRPIGTLNCLRIWHDNAGKGRKASWFLKFIIMHDLQTRERFYFICNDWLGLDKSDGLVDRMLPVATSREKTDLKYLMEKQTKEKMRDGHLWFSILARPTESSFTRTDRLTCAFVLLCLSMMMNILYYDIASSSGSKSNDVNIGPFTLSQTQVVIGVITNLVIFPPSFLLLQIFRSSRRRETRSTKLKKMLNQNKKFTALEVDDSDDQKENQKRKKKAKRKFSLPWWFKIVGYTLSLAIVGVCLFFILVKGISFGDDTCRRWLSSFVISIITSVFLTQPIQVMFLSIFFVLLFRKSDDSQDLEYDHEDDGSALNKAKYENRQQDDTTQTLLSRYEFNNTAHISELKAKREQERKAWLMIKKLIIYSLFLSILSVAAFSKTNSLSFKYQTQLQNLILPNITLIKTTDHMWSWLSDQFLECVKASEWYNQQNSGLDNYVRDYSSVMVGTILLRQARVRSYQCSRVAGKNICYSDYSASNYEHSDYGLEWGSYDSNAIQTNVSRAFQYTKASTIDSQPFAGAYTNYLGGGYVFKIDSKNQQISDIQSDLATLQANNWVDLQTRALFVEFTVYNANLDLFAYCLILFEFLPTGNIVSYFEINPINLYSDESIVYLVFNILYMFVIVFVMLKEIKLMIKLGCKKYLTHWWSYLDWSLIALSWTAFAVFLSRLYERYQLSSKIKSSNSSGQVVNFQLVNYWNQTLLILLGYCCFLATLRVIKLVSLSRSVKMIAQTMSECFKEMFSLLFISLLMIFAFVQMMYIMVNNSNDQFKSFATSLVTGFLMMLGKFNVDSFCQDAGVVGTIVYCGYVVTVILVLTNLIIAVMSDKFSKIRAEQKAKEIDEPSPIWLLLNNKLFGPVKSSLGMDKKRKRNELNKKASQYQDPTQLLEKRTLNLVEQIHVIKNE